MLYFARNKTTFLYDLIFMLGETDPTDEKLETAEIKRRSVAETELDLPTESLGKIINTIIKNNFTLLSTYIC